MRERLIYAAPAGMRIDGCPDSLARLTVERQHVPVGRGPLKRRTRCPMQAHVILAPAPVRNLDCPLAAIFQKRPERTLVIARPPQVWKPDFTHAIAS